MATKKKKVNIMENYHKKGLFGHTIQYVSTKFNQKSFHEQFSIKCKNFVQKTRPFDCCHGNQKTNNLEIKDQDNQMF